MDLARFCWILDHYWYVTFLSVCLCSSERHADHSIAGANNSAWTAGSTLLALGLSVGQAMGVIVGGSFIISIIAVVAGWMGSHNHLGFTVMSRA
jgi:hypothetical protein